MNVISKTAKIGTNVEIGDFTVIHDNVIIGNNTTIGDNCVIGLPTNLSQTKKLVVGDNSHIRSHCILYSGSTFEEGLITGHHVLVRENTVAGKSLRIGSYSELEGDTSIGHYVSIHSKVMLSKLTDVGNFVWLFPRTQTSTDPLPPSDIEKPISIKDLAVVAINSLILPGVTIGFGSYVSAGSVVKNDVPDTYCVAGNPAKIFARIDRLIDFKNRIKHPWPKYNTNVNYPSHGKEMLAKLSKEIERLVNNE